MTSIKNFSNYLIYNSGEIYSIKRKIFLKARFDKDNYKRVDLSNKNKSKTFFVHQLVAIAYLNHDLSKNLCIDHINNDRTNNYLHNLQIITKEQNSRKVNIKKKSGLQKGVHKSGNKYISKICINREQIILGVFDTEEEASECYNNKFNELMVDVKI